MNIDRYRPIAAVILILVLIVSNASFLLAYNNGPDSAANYSAKWDVPQVKVVNLLLLSLLVALALIKPKVSEEEA